MNTKKFTLDKVIGGKLCSRSITIERHNKLGQCILVKSTNGTQKTKNIIPIFMQNPITQSNSNTGLLQLSINRVNEKPIILTSTNEVVTKIFYDYVKSWVEVSHLLHNKLHRWSDPPGAKYQPLGSPVANQPAAMQTPNSTRNAVMLQCSYGRKIMGAGGKGVSL